MARRALSGDTSWSASGILGFAAVLAFGFSFYVWVFKAFVLQSSSRNHFYPWCFGIKITFFFALDGRANGWGDFSVALSFDSMANFSCHSSEMSFNLFLMKLYVKTMKNHRLWSAPCVRTSFTSMRRVLKDRQRRYLAKNGYRVDVLSDRLALGHSFCITKGLSSRFT